MAFTKRAPLEKQTITIEKATQWGPVANDALYGFNEPLTPNDFVVGETIDVLVKRSAPTEKYPDGKMYIAQIIGKGEAKSVSEVLASLPKAKDLMRDEVAPAVNQVAKETKAAVRPGSYNDVNDEKSVRILWQGVVQHALVSPALATLPFKDADAYLALVKDVSAKAVQIIREGK